EVHDFVEHLVSGGDGPRVALKSALNGDHIDELGGEVDVRRLECAGYDAAVTAFSRCGDRWLTGIDGGGEQSVSLAEEAFGRGEPGGRQLPHDKTLSVAVQPGDRTIGAD